MIVNVEFFDENLIENVITSLNYKVDKIILFGYEDAMVERKNCMENFLKNICKVKEVEWCDVDRIDLASIMDTISTQINEEVRKGNQVFFDLTGGESLPLVAFGMLSKELMAPMHMYDISKNEMYEYGYEGSCLMSETAEFDPISLNLDEFISLYGGVVHGRMHKDYKETDSKEEDDLIITLWNLSQKHRKKWLAFSALFRKFAPDNKLKVCVPEKKFLTEIKRDPKLGSADAVWKFMDECKNAGFFLEFTHNNGTCSYSYKNEAIKNYFWDGGSILEMYTFLKEICDTDPCDCRVGVHIDWDGVIHNSSDQDVLNEIDIISMHDNLPTFISCKIGNVDQRALYELETVASRFGGKYAKMVLAVAKEISPAHLLRAKEMGIEVRVMK